MKISTLEKYLAGGIVGGVVGGVIGIVAGLHGSYEIGTSINDYYHIQNTCGRITLDAVVMTVATPIVGSISGLIGAGAGTIGVKCLDYITNKSENKGGN